ncbi:MAG: hypothetical protein CEE40_07600 [Chloroflexi bacterium B3_Chlor]|nr:MAG: hypothetical protein CEE40_07600 [Chloroflexi bacterium B3_Chlor]
MSPRAKRHEKQEVRWAVDTKVPGEYRCGKEENYWIVLEGKRRFMVRVPKGRGPLGIGLQGRIKKDLRLTTELFEDLVDCSLTGPKYEQYLLQRLAEDRL